MHSSDFDYELPDEKIAKHPVSPRRVARLLKASSPSSITHHTFEHLPKILDEHGCDGLWVNDTKVLQARLYMLKPTGGRLEIFLLEPLDGVAEQALSATKESSWRCMVLGGRKWTSGYASIQLGDIVLEARPINPEEGLVKDEGGTFKLTFYFTGAD